MATIEQPKGPEQASGKTILFGVVDDVGYEVEHEVLPNLSTVFVR